MSDVSKVKVNNITYDLKDPDIRGEVATLIASHEKFEVIGTAYAGGSVTLTDARIDSDHWKIPKNGIYFGTPSSVASIVSWATNTTTHTVTLTATFTGTTTVALDFEYFQ